MGKLIKLNIVAPGREVLTEEIVSLATTESDGKIEFLANYAPTIIATIPTITTYTTIDGNKKNLFTSSHKKTVSLMRNDFFIITLQLEVIHPLNELMLILIDNYYFHALI